MSRSLRPRVLLADDHRMVAEGLRSLLSPEFELLDVVEDGLALLAAARKLRPDLIVADISMPDLNGIDALVRLRKEQPDVKVVFLTMHQDEAYATRALEAGASGFVLKHSAPAELITAMRAALNNQTYVTPALARRVFQAMRTEPQKSSEPLTSLSARQREILQLLAEGLSAKEVAGKLQISARTVEFHKYQIMEVLNLRHSAELIHFAIKHGLVAI